MLGNHINITYITVILSSSELESLKKNSRRVEAGFSEAKSRVPRPRHSLLYRPVLRSRVTLKKLTSFRFVSTVIERPSCLKIFCTTEKKIIIFKPELSSLNSRNELGAHCRHKKSRLLLKKPRAKEKT